MRDIIINKPRTLGPSQLDTADKAYEHLLDIVGKVSPELTEVLQKKYEDDRREFTQAAQDMTPSHDPAYWAKSSCSKCYGRGIIGKRHFFMPGQSAKVVRGENGEKVLTNSVTKMDIRCKCASKGYQKWLATFRTFFNMLKAQTAAEAITAAAEESGDDNEA